MIRTIIIDDEPAATSLLSLMLTKCCHDSIEIVCVANDPFEGRQQIIKNKPDLVFLDVEMSGMNGIQLMKSFHQPFFKVVFVTAHDKYALEALKLSAIEYLIKPVDLCELIGAVEKIKLKKNQIEFDQIQQHSNLEKLYSIMEHKIGIAMADKIIFIPIAEIIYCEAHGPYTSIYFSNGNKITASKSLIEFELQLTSQRFYRIHHSYLINLNKIREYQRYDGGFVIMENEVKLDVSQRKRKEFLLAIDSIVI